LNRRTRCTLACARMERQWQQLFQCTATAQVTYRHVPQAVTWSTVCHQPALAKVGSYLAFVSILIVDPIQIGIVMTLIVVMTIMEDNCLSTHHSLSSIVLIINCPNHQLSSLLTVVNNLSPHCPLIVHYPCALLSSYPSFIFHCTQHRYSSSSTVFINFCHHFRHLLFFKSLTVIIMNNHHCHITLLSTVIIHSHHQLSASSSVFLIHSHPHQQSLSAHSSFMLYVCHHSCCMFVIHSPKYLFYHL